MKTKLTLISFILFLLPLSAYAYSPYVSFTDGRTLDFNPDVWCTVNDKFIDFNSNGIPFLCYTENLPEGLVNYIPVRTIAEALGLDLSYNDASKAVELKNKDTVMRFYNDNSVIEYFDAAFNIKGTSDFATAAGTLCPVRIIEDTTYVPIRVVTESFGYSIDFNNNQLIIADSPEKLVPRTKEDLAVTVSIYNMYPDISISKTASSAGLDKFLENNGLSDLTGSVCRSNSGWTIGTADTDIRKFNMVIPASYSDIVYFKPDENSSWTKLNDAESADKIYAVSSDVWEANFESTSVIFETPAEIKDTIYRRIFESLAAQITLPKKMMVEKYTASYNPIITDKPSDAELYRIQDSKTHENYYVLIYDDKTEFLDSSIFADISFNETVTLSLPSLASLTVYSEIIMVDITDDI